MIRAKESGVNPALQKPLHQCGKLHSGGVKRSQRVVRLREEVRVGFSCDLPKVLHDTGKKRQDVEKEKFKQTKVSRGEDVDQGKETTPGDQRGVHMLWQAVWG